MPEGYRGVVVTVTGRENTLRHKIEEQDIAEEGNDEEEQATELQEMGSFKEIVLWDHERVVDREDAFAKGLGEWIGFAGAVSHAQSSARTRSIMTELLICCPIQMHKPGQVKGT